MEPGSRETILEVRGVSKRFPGVQALAEVDLSLAAGEVLALVGENGAGKSTLIKILAGALRPDAGEVRLYGCRGELASPAEARRRGIAVMYQEFSLVPALSVAANIFLGRETSAVGVIAQRGEWRRARELLEQLGAANIDPRTPCRALSTAQQQLVEIAKALATDARLLVMDEPTAALSPAESERLLAIARGLRARGLGILFVSHRLEEVLQVADRVMVLRDGRLVAMRPRGEVDREWLIEAMVGRRLEQEFPRRAVAVGEPRLVVRDLRRGKRVCGVTFSIRRGEVLGLTGLVGAGRSETARLICGADRRDGGTIEVDGRPVELRSPRDGLRAGIALLPEDRKSQGLVLSHSVRHNFSLPNLPRLSRAGWIVRRRERCELEHWLSAAHVRIAAAEQPAGQLSGGNQQKLLLARWLAARCEVLLFDEPTRGVDVAAKFEIYQLINNLAAAGKAVLLISSELPEVMGMCDRILVMQAGRIRGELVAAEATQEQIMRLAVG
jgi:ABC-type sugar transport system ATPase subunit